jgi:mono/diheme cytochrome c family protein
MDIIPPQGRGKKPQPMKPVHFTGEPVGLAELRKVPNTAITKKLPVLDELLVWPGKPGYVEAEVKPLTAEEKARFEAGKELYTTICGACHQPTGLGLEGLAPPLVDSDWATGSPARMARIVLQGVRGSINVKGRTWGLEMPPLNILTDEQIADALTYVRREWGHTASPVDPAFVAKVRAETEKREDAWTEPELLKIQ